MAQRKGELIIYFGMAAGVGKTYAMLKDAETAAKNGVDLVVGWIEPHGRPETESLAAQLERITPLRLDYRGVELTEPDFPAILKRAPRVVLVDELAHSNAPGLRHEKRWQDIIDLTDSGISVWTTLNVQHLESVADLVEDITQSKIRERIPDTFLDKATDIRLIDLSPEALRQRLAEGKVYQGEARNQALERFFKSDHLSSLRHLALRRATQSAQKHGSPGQPILPGVDSSLLLAISSSPNSEYLVRWGYRLASALGAAWHCISVDTGSMLSDADRQRLSRTRDLAQSLGAGIESRSSSDPVQAIVKFARERSVGLIVVGKSGIAAGLFGAAGRLRPTFTEKLIKESEGIPVVAVQERPISAPSRRPRGPRDPKTFAKEFALMLCALSVTTALGALIAPNAGYVGVSILYFGMIMAGSFFFSAAVTVGAAALSALAWNFFFIPPTLTFQIGTLSDWLLFLLFFAIATFSAALSSRVRAEGRLIKARESKLRRIAELSQKLNAAATVEGVAEEIGAFFLGTFSMESVLFETSEKKLSGKDGGLDDVSKSALTYCLHSGQDTGTHTKTFPSSRYHFSRLNAADLRIGAIGVRISGDRPWTRELEEEFASFLPIISNTIARAKLEEKNRAQAVADSSAKLGKLLLNSVSHEMRTPLTLIKGSASALEDPVLRNDPNAIDGMLDAVLEGAERLETIVENLLSMNRIEAGVLRLSYTNTDMREICTLAVKRRQKSLGKRRIELGGDTSDFRCDLGLMVHVLENLLANAARHTPESTAISLRYGFNSSTGAKGGSVWLDVHDNGPGVAESELPDVFERFRAKGRGSANLKGTIAASGGYGDGHGGGLGLGLGICKGIVELHGGTINAENRNGLLIHIELPLRLQSDA